MNLVEKLNSYDDNYWDFSNYREKNIVIKYPAMMVAPMQHKLLEDILQFDNTIHNVFDPFMGSGTVLVTGKELGLDVIGYDINPLATLISRTRLYGIPYGKIEASIDQLNSNISLLLGNTENLQFTNIEKWFRQDIIESLSLLRSAIVLEPDIQIRRFYWCCFSEIVKKYCNSRSSTFKLHIKEENTIQAMENDCISEFRNEVINYYRDYISTPNNCNIILKTGNSLKLLSSMEENSIDLICTSPPYGDNQTTVTYGQYSILPLLWIDNNDLDEFDHSLLNNFSAIDRESLGGKIKRNNTNLYEDFLYGVSDEKKKKVISFWSDYEAIFTEMARVLKHGKLLVLTLGNRRVDNIELPFDKLNDFLAEKYGLLLEATLTRNIVGKHMPFKVSHLANHGSVHSMNKEYIKIYRKAE